MSTRADPPAQLSGPETDALVSLLCDAYVQMARHGYEQTGGKLLDMIELLRVRQHAAAPALVTGEPR